MLTVVVGHHPDSTSTPLDAPRGEPGTCGRSRRRVSQACALTTASYALWVARGEHTQCMPTGAKALEHAASFAMPSRRVATGRGRLAEGDENEHANGFCTRERTRVRLVRSCDRWNGRVPFPGVYAPAGGWSSAGARGRVRAGWWAHQWHVRPPRAGKGRPRQGPDPPLPARRARILGAPLCSHECSGR